MPASISPLSPCGRGAGGEGTCSAWRVTATTGWPCARHSRATRPPRYPQPTINFVIAQKDSLVDHLVASNQQQGMKDLHVNGLGDKTHVAVGEGDIETGRMRMAQSGNRLLGVVFPVVGFGPGDGPSAVGLDNHDRVGTFRP